MLKWNEYNEASRELLTEGEYIVQYFPGFYQRLHWCDGWNCHRDEDGEVWRDCEIMTVEAWAEVPADDDSGWRTDTSDLELSMDEYLVMCENGLVYGVGWCDGWNCSINTDGTIYRGAEFTDVIKFMDVEPYEKGGEIA